jgi:hypothetical protein
VRRHQHRGISIGVKVKRLNSNFHFAVERTTAFRQKSLVQFRRDVHTNGGMIWRAARHSEELALVELVLFVRFAFKSQILLNGVNLLG